MVTRRGKGRGVATVIRERAGAAATPISVTATTAKNEFGRLLNAAVHGQHVMITRHNATRAVLLSKAEYDALAGTAGASLDSLTAEFDAMFEQMQTPAARTGTRAAFRDVTASARRATLARRRG